MDYEISLLQTRMLIDNMLKKVRAEKAKETIIGFDIENGAPMTFGVDFAVWANGDKQPLDYPFTISYPRTTHQTILDTIKEFEAKWAKPAPFTIPNPPRVPLCKDRNGDPVYDGDTVYADENLIGRVEQDRNALNSLFVHIQGQHTAAFAYERFTKDTSWTVKKKVPTPRLEEAKKKGWTRIKKGDSPGWREQPMSGDQRFVAVWYDTSPSASSGWALDGLTDLPTPAF